MKTIEDYRVVEQIDGFVIQKKIVFEEVIGYFSVLGFGERTKKEVWRNVDSKGNILVAYLGGQITEAKEYNTLEEAKEAVEKFLKYPIYHYFTEDSQDGYPKFPTDRTS